ncbi:alcohol oxidase [Polyplosphaeria fusca]|uniref:Alcohol oxidase n=1 Tax=Polyplosphaeria fusca TaxID=682080 RepID=A0A9P4QTK1_9PLEO|nr:alcohol oxidase [Polyplosphaeria fusca]
MYNITSLPNPQLNNRTYPVKVGAVLGGSSAIDGLFGDRGSKADYDAWETLGNPGWSFSSLLPYFKKSVTFTPPSPDEAKAYNYTWDISAYGGNGTGGPVQVSLPSYNWPQSKHIWEAWKQMGIPRQNEGANGNAFNTFVSPTFLDPVTRTRSYARTAHWDPYKNRTNYKYNLLSGYQVTEIRLITGRLRAVGVNVVKRGTAGPKIAIQSKRQVILAAGAVWTPWLLQRSGLGPKSVLEAANIPVIKDIPGVGANLQDHPYSAPPSKFTNDLIPSPEYLLANATAYEEAKREYEQSRTGPLTLARGHQAAFLPLKTWQPQWKDLIRALLSQTASNYLPAGYDKNLTDGFIAQRNVVANLFNQTDNAAVEFNFGPVPLNGGALLRTLSRGTVTLNATDPLAAPLVDFRTFTNPIDVANAVAAIRYSHRVNSQPALKGLGPVGYIPELNATSDSEIEKALRESLMLPSFSHMSGTAAMLPEQYGGVVGPDLGVYGIRKLSVVDASIIPLIPATHLTATVYAVAEKVSLRTRVDFFFSRGFREWF